MHQNTNVKWFLAELESSVYCSILQLKRFFWNAILSKSSLLKPSVSPIVPGIIFRSFNMAQRARQDLPLILSLILFLIMSLSPPPTPNVALLNNLQSVPWWSKFSTLEHATIFMAYLSTLNIPFPSKISLSVSRLYSINIYWRTDLWTSFLELEKIVTEL